MTTYRVTFLKIDGTQAEALVDADGVIDAMAKVETDPKTAPIFAAVAQACIYDPETAPVSRLDAYRIK